ncbi:DUF1858 domain-containing protein [uncultured Methanobrevibacter sp.]|uniref:DUF1858 domain-containing protein n=1 Tax=uncultured Methanobrevibacter sp. TaxID=253161 RepID=UPI0025E582E7|nr:DUF1858 domain-containing protein [uncultured Methanobrevibacter sp.]
MVEITPETKLMDLLNKYPFLKDELPDKNPKFKMFKTPMAKVLMRNADINKMSKRSGMSVDEIISMLKELIENH